MCWLTGTSLEVEVEVVVLANRKPVLRLRLLCWLTGTSLEVEVEVVDVDCSQLFIRLEGPKCCVVCANWKQPDRLYAHFYFDRVTHLAEELHRTRQVVSLPVLSARLGCSSFSLSPIVEV